MKRSFLLGVMAMGLMACSGAALPSEDDSANGGGTKSGASGSAEPPTPGTAEGTAAGPANEPPSAGGGGYPGCDPSGGACFDVYEPQACGPYGKEIASKLCGAQGMTPTAISQSPKGCIVTCCGGAGGGGGKPQPPPPPKPPEPPTPPQPPPAACSWQALGAGGACIAFGDLKGQADALCQAQKANLTQLYSANDCPGGTTIAKVQCCWGATPPPAPPPANAGGGGGGVPEPKK